MCIRDRSNDPNTEKRIPTQFASFGELKRLLNIVRKYDRVWQTTPIIENRLMALFYFTPPAVACSASHSRPQRSPPWR